MPTLTLPRGPLALLIVAGLALIGAVVLLMAGKTVPSELWTVVLGAITGGAGATVPHTPTTTTGGTP